jgi:hypothetical protein
MRVPFGSLGAGMIAALLVTLGWPHSAAALVAASPSRLMLVEVDVPWHDILARFEASARAWGLICSHQFLQYKSNANPQLTCAPEWQGVNRGSVSVLYRKDKRAVAVMAYAPNVLFPDGELDPAVDATLRDFKKGLIDHRNVVRVEYCWGRDSRRCSFSD